jgi:hypothetical protein
MHTVLKNSGPMSHKTHCKLIMKTTWLILFMEITAVYLEHYIKHINIL